MIGRQLGIRIEIDRVRVRRERLVLPIDGTRPIDNLVVVSFGVLHRLKHQLSIDRRHAPDDSLERAAMQRPLGQFSRRLLSFSPARPRRRLESSSAQRSVLDV